MKWEGLSFLWGKQVAPTGGLSSDILSLQALEQWAEKRRGMFWKGRQKKNIYFKMRRCHYDSFNDLFFLAAIG